MQHRLMTRFASMKTEGSGLSFGRCRCVNKYFPDFLAAQTILWDQFGL
jgi:hypothetical protein